MMSNIVGEELKKRASATTWRWNSRRCPKTSRCQCSTASGVGEVGRNDHRGTVPGRRARRGCHAMGGERTGWVFEDERVSFVEMAKRSRSGRESVGGQRHWQGDLVATWMPSLREFAEIEYACARLGAIVVPINTRFKSFEVSHMLKETENETADRHRALPQERLCRDAGRTRCPGRRLSSAWPRRQRRPACQSPTDELG